MSARIAQTKIEPSDVTIPEFRVTYPEVELLVTTRMSGRSVVGFSFRDAKKT